MGNAEKNIYERQINLIKQRWARGEKRFGDPALLKFYQKKLEGRE